PAVRQRWQGLLEAYFDGRAGLRGIVITVDARRGLMDLDVTMIDWAGSLGVPVLLLMTKTDKLSRNEAARVRLSVAAAAPDEVAGVIAFSALTGEGADEAREQLERWFEGAATRRQLHRG